MDKSDLDFIVRKCSKELDKGSALHPTYRKAVGVLKKNAEQIREHFYPEKTE